MTKIFTTVAQRGTLKMVHKVFSALCFVLITTCQVWIYFQTSLGMEHFLTTIVPIRAIETVVATILITLLRASLFPLLKTSKVLYLLAMLVADPALFSWGNSISGTSLSRNWQSESQPSPHLYTRSWSSGTKF